MRNVGGLLTVALLSWSRPCRADTYHVEHEVSEESARLAAEEADPVHLMSHAIGCDACTDNEMNYCNSAAVIQDHCCCDGRYIESFPYVPHTCYRGRETCRPVKKDCEEYIRLKDCCCRSRLAAKWKSRLQVNGAAAMSSLRIIQTILTIYYFSHYFR